MSPTTMARLEDGTTCILTEKVPAMRPRDSSARLSPPVPQGGRVRRILVGAVRRRRGDPPSDTATDAGAGSMHEGFDPRDPARCARPRFGARAR